MAVTGYDYQLHGGPNGYGGSRSVLRLYDEGHNTVAYLHFVPTGQPIPNDVEAAPWPRMFLPEAMLPAVVDMLRNESPIGFYFASGSGFLHTSTEPVGEGEIGH